MVDVGRGIHFAAGFGVLVAIEFSHDTLGQLTRAGYACGNGIGSLTRITAHTAMVETGVRIGFATILIKIIAILKSIGAARYGTHSLNAAEFGIDYRRADFIAGAAMVIARIDIGFADGLGIAVAFGKTRGTSAALPTAALPTAPIGKFSDGRCTAASNEECRANECIRCKQSRKLVCHDAQAITNCSKSGREIAGKNEGRLSCPAVWR